MDFDKNLGAYPNDVHKDWDAISNFISKESLNKIVFEKQLEIEIEDEGEGDIE